MPTSPSPDARSLTRIASDRHWYGWLTLHNTEAVADRLRRLIGNGQPYTWVATTSESGLRPQVRTSQRADEIHHEPGYVEATDSYGVWSFRTRVADMREAVRRGWDDLDRVFLNFEHNRLSVQHFAPAGVELHWVIVLEDHES